MSVQPSTTAPISASPQTAHVPEFFRLPARGIDPHFGLSRSFYYQAERDGHFKMVRLRRPGSLRGVVLVPYAAVRDMIERRKE